IGFDGFVRVTNNSGEDYEDAKVRLIVGTINLVEKIAQLAQIPVTELGTLSMTRRNELQDQAAQKAMRELPAPVGAPMAVTPPPQEKQIIKEGLSEYFVFSIEGTETIKTGWSKRMRAIEAAKVPVKVQYRYRPAE